MKMKNSMDRSLRLVAAGLVLALAFILAGCSGSRPGNNDNDKSGAHDDALGRVVTLKLRFAQVNRTLDQLEQDVEVQKRNIDSARAELKSIQHALGKGHLKQYSLDSITSDIATLKRIRYEQKHQKNIEENNHREKAEDAKSAVLSTLVILLFIAFLVLVGFAFWRDRNSLPDTFGSYSPPPDDEEIPPIAPASDTPDPSENDDREL